MCKQRRRPCVRRSSDIRVEHPKSDAPAPKLVHGYRTGPEHRQLEPDRGMAQERQRVTASGLTRRTATNSRPWAAAQFNSAASWRAASGGEPNSINRFAIADSESKCPQPRQAATPSYPRASASCSVRLWVRSLNRLLHFEAEDLVFRQVKAWIHRGVARFDGSHAGVPSSH